MIDERAMQAAAAALEANWIDQATSAEVDMLLASGARPELFEKRLEDHGEIRIVLGYGGDHPNVRLMGTA